MPELTVSMPVYNSSKFIGEAISSVLAQEEVDFELIVVDDGSNDGSADVVASFDDPRIKYIRNDTNSGIAYCHNLAVERSCSSFISHVDSDDLVLPGALQKMLRAMRRSPRIGQAHCNYFFIDEDGGRIDMQLSSVRTPQMDYKREILVCGGIINHLRTYRMDALRDVGGFDETLKFSIDTEIALRIADKHEIMLVPEYLYCRRIHSRNSSDGLRLKELRYWYQRYRFTRRLMRDRKINYLSGGGYHFNRLMAEGLRRALISCAVRISGSILKKSR
jgi:glycosyltransferase involved in cell wall biosynthesis